MAKKPKQLYFALVVMDEDTKSLKFTCDSNAKMFAITGEVEKRTIIPQTILKEVVERMRTMESK